ncbi:MAG: lysophospholipid acyltransferase family protein [Myxococcota bacterium]
MSPTIEDVARLPVDVLRALLPSWVAGHADLPDTRPLEAALRARTDAASDAELNSLLEAFAAAGEAYRLYPAHPFARDMTRLYMAALTPTWDLVGREPLERFLATGPRRKMIVCNHLSYTDTQITDSLLVLAGLREVADRLVAIAGPKVYTDAWRRMAAISLNTRKTAQSSAVATEQGALSPRELAAVAFETIADCERLMDEGYVVLLYPEGTRSRTGRLQPFLRAAARYCSVPDLQILPLAQSGTDRVYPIDAAKMYAAHVRMAFGEPFVAADFPGKATALAEAHRRVADLLPPDYRPEDGAPAVS